MTRALFSTSITRMSAGSAPPDVFVPTPTHSTVAVGLSCAGRKPGAVWTFSAVGNSSPAVVGSVSRSGRSPPASRTAPKAVSVSTPGPPRYL